MGCESRRITLKNARIQYYPEGEMKGMKISFFCGNRISIKTDVFGKGKFSMKTDSERLNMYLKQMRSHFCVLFVLAYQTCLC